jgi:hypothetical protein
VCCWFSSFFHAERKITFSSFTHHMLALAKKMENLVMCVTRSPNHFTFRVGHLTVSYPCC